MLFSKHLLKLTISGIDWNHVIEPYLLCTKMFIVLCIIRCVFVYKCQTNDYFLSVILNVVKRHIICRINNFSSYYVIHFFPRLFSNVTSLWHHQTLKTEDWM